MKILNKIENFKKYFVTSRCDNSTRHGSLSLSIPIFRAKGQVMSKALLVIDMQEATLLSVGTPKKKLIQGYYDVQISEVEKMNQYVTGAVIKELREKNIMTQLQLAEAFSVSVAELISGNTVYNSYPEMY